MHEVTRIGDKLLIEPVVMDSIETLERVVAEMKEYASANILTEEDVHTISQCGERHEESGLVTSRGYDNRLAPYQRHIAVRDDGCLQLQWMVTREGDMLVEQLTIQDMEKKPLDEMAVRCLASVFWVEGDRDGVSRFADTPDYVTLLCREIPPAHDHSPYQTTDSVN